MAPPTAGCHVKFDPYGRSFVFRRAAMEAGKWEVLRKNGWEEREAWAGLSLFTMSERKRNNKVFNDNVTSGGGDRKTRGAADGYKVTSV